MKIEILYFDGCPNHKPAVELVSEMLREEGISASVSEVNVPDEPTARAVGFLGSPSIRVEGLDVEPAARSSREYGILCRTYQVAGRSVGLPSRDTIRQALREGQPGVPTTDQCCLPDAGSAAAEKSTGGSFLMAGSVVAAVVASFCCILPIVFAVTGFSILGASALFAAWRPYLLGLTFGLLGLGFYFAYRPRKGQCAPGSACAMPGTLRSGRLLIWLVTAAVVLFAAFPYYSGPVAGFFFSHTSRGDSGAAEAREVVHATFAVEGMDCAACATALQERLKAVAGVRKATVSFEEKKADIDYDPQSARPAEMEKAIEDAGYRARRV
jgi:copper chaperone CopZ